MTERLTFITRRWWRCLTSLLSVLRVQYCTRFGLSLWVAATVNRKTKGRHVSAGPSSSTSVRRHQQWRDETDHLADSERSNRYFVNRSECLAFFILRFHFSCYSSLTLAWLIFRRFFRLVSCHLLVVDWCFHSNMGIFGGWCCLPTWVATWLRIVGCRDFFFLNICVVFRHVVVLSVLSFEWWNETAKRKQSLCSLASSMRQAIDAEWKKRRQGKETASNK